MSGKYDPSMSMPDKLNQLVKDGMVQNIVLRPTEDNDELAITFNNGERLVIQARLSRLGDATMYIDGRKFPGDTIYIYSSKELDPIKDQGKFVINND